jgi:LemA protein
MSVGGWVAIGACFVVIAGWAVVAYNRLVRDKNLALEGFSGIDVQLKRRCDLVPMLVATVSGYTTHEGETLQRVTEQRARAASATALDQRRDAENALTDGLKQLFAVVEAYPDLKADQQYLNLMTQLVEIEERLQMARRYYNGAVRNMNIRVDSFPSNLVAGVFGFGRVEYFKIETATDREPPKVELDS